MGGNEGEFGIRNNTFELLFWLTTMPNLVESGRERAINPYRGCDECALKFGWQGLRAE
ncbi:MAG: hypothetical protein WCI87_00490 [Euryarchaeota archaeon]